MRLRFLVDAKVIDVGGVGRAVRQQIQQKTQTQTIEQHFR